MNDLLRDVLVAVAPLLDQKGARWCVIGGIAVSARTEPRFTKDLDLAVAVEDDAQAEATIRWLLAHGFEILSVLEQTATGRLATVRLLRNAQDGERNVVDLLFASSGIEVEVVEGSTPVELFPQVEVNVAAIPHLIAMKVLAANDRHRHQDLADIEALMAEAAEEELEEAERLLGLMAARRSHRGKDLIGELRALRARQPRG